MRIKQHRYEAREGDGIGAHVWCKHCNTTRDEIPGTHFPEQRNRRTGQHSFEHGRTAALREEHFEQRPVPVYDPARGFPLLQHDDAKPARALEEFGVQAWSQGALYPCVIAVIERYEEPLPRYAFIGTPAYAAYINRLETEPLEARLRSRSFELTLDGHSEEYASREDAEQVAKALLESSAVRYQWSRGEL